MHFTCGSFVEQVLVQKTGLLFFLGDLPFPNQKINVERVNTTFSKYNKIHRNNEKSNLQKSGIMLILWSSFGSTFVIGTVLKLANDVLLYLTPLVSYLMANLTKISSPPKVLNFDCVLILILITQGIVKQDFDLLFQLIKFLNYNFRLIIMNN